jgi:hypothetical protein
MGACASKDSTSPPTASKATSAQSEMVGELQEKTLRRWCVYCLVPAGTGKFRDSSVEVKRRLIRDVYDSEEEAAVAAKSYTEKDGVEHSYMVSNTYMCDVGTINIYY